MNLQEIEQALQERLEHLQRIEDSGIDEHTTWNEWLAVYNALIACRQAQALERQTRATEMLVDLLHAFDEFGVPIKERK